MLLWTPSPAPARSLLRGRFVAEVGISLRKSPWGNDLANPCKRRASPSVSGDRKPCYPLGLRQKQPDSTDSSDANDGVAAPSTVGELAIRRPQRRRTALPHGIPSWERPAGEGGMSVHTTTLPDADLGIPKGWVAPVHGLKPGIRIAALAAVVQPQGGQRHGEPSTSPWERQFPCTWPPDISCALADRHRPRRFAVEIRLQIAIWRVRLQPLQWPDSARDTTSVGACHADLLRLRLRALDTLAIPTHAHTERPPCPTSMTSGLGKRGGVRSTTSASRLLGTADRAFPTLSS